MWRLKLGLAVLAMLLASSRPAKAAVIVLDFEGLVDLENVQNFYNDGTGSAGSSGIDYGVEFSDSALALIDGDAGGMFGNFNGEPSPSTVMIFLAGGPPAMNVADGFTTGLSFFYAAIYIPGAVSIYDGLNGSGNLLATAILPVTPQGPGDPTGDQGPFQPFGLSFGGTARSVVFTGVEDQIGFDNVTFGSSTPGGGGTPAIPEPSSLALLGIGVAGGLLRRRRQRSRS